MPLTPDSALELLFPEEFVPQQIKDELPPELHVRPTSLGITLI
jgi:glucosamine-phosphate N-acetyltransferase